MLLSLTSHEKSGNQQFAVELTKWTFHERGHLKVCALQVCLSFQMFAMF